MNSQYPGFGHGPAGPPGQDPLIGQTIGNYLVRQKLGEGGMGSVYLAEHPHIGKKVALKVLHAEFASNQDVVSRFFNEAKAVNDIGHPNIVDILDYGVIQAGPASGEGMVYFIMEFLPGLTLTELIRRDAPLAPERALQIAMQVADALSASHKTNIVHRDLKPDNIMLSQRGRERDFVKLLDFGIAKLTGDQPGSRRTRTGIVMGTPAYMSPEQCEGRGNVDHRTDIYALGIVIYEMITGRVPFQGDGYGEVLVQHLTQMPVPPSTIRGLIPPHVEAVVMKALNKRPDDRYPNMDEFMKALADPVGYVEAHGGLAGFQQAPLVATNVPFSPPSRPTPLPTAPVTPVPSSIYGIPPTTPTTIGGSTGQISSVNIRKIGLIAGIGIATAGGVFAAVMMIGGHKNTAGAGTNTPIVENPPAPDAATPSTSPPIDAAPIPEVVVDAPTPTGTDTGSGDDAGTKEPGNGSNGQIDTAPEMVTITVESTPPDAKVYFGSEKTSRGNTPTSFKVPKSNKKAKIRVELSGYFDSKSEISLDSSQNLDPVLKKKTTRPVPTPGTGSAGDGTLNPFRRRTP